MPLHYDYAVFIGRFQPFHRGHLYGFEEALKSADRLMVLVGSSGGARTLRNPFTFGERVEIMRTALPHEISSRIDFLPLLDFTYDDAWVSAVTATVEKTVSNNNKTIALVGHDKDETTYYLKLFPTWEYIEVGNLKGISATTVRNNYFSLKHATTFTSSILDSTTITWLTQFAQTVDYQRLAAEYQVAMRYRDDWSNTPYPVTFTTADAVIKWHDEILLIKRKNFPGKGLYALPGGFLNTDETLFDACVRELVEETSIDISSADLKNAVVRHNVYDNPKRSSRGRVVTYCYFFDVSYLPEKPSVVAADDALSTHWLSLTQFERSQFFEDHYFIIHHLLKE